MDLSSGKRLGPYEVIELLGAGGMGEVYRALDTRLNRTVAIKILPSQFSSDLTHKRRFEREAKAIARLNHPHICTLYDVGQEDGTDYLVMEYVEGETLGQRLIKGRLPLNQVLRLGTQIADALDQAHRSGIIHRDVKPGNIVLTSTGAKLLDFGLARPAAVLSDPNTLTAATSKNPVTQRGTVIGTFEYMSPEQIEGSELDGRSDIFSLGAVLYEMLTGRRAFMGKSQLSVVSAILEKDPAPITSIEPMTPPILDHAIRRCMAKDPDLRWQNARDLAGELNWISEDSSAFASRAEPPRLHLRRERVAWTAVILFVIATAAWFYWARPPVEEYALDFKIEPPSGSDFILANGGGDAISPDGKSVAFVASSSRGAHLWIRPLDTTEAHELVGTENAQFPFWSPDSRSVGFFADGKLKRIDLAGGPPVALAEAPNSRGGAWSPQGTIIFAPIAASGLWKVAATGGASTQLTSVNQIRGEFTQRWPLLLSDGNHFLYLTRGEKAGVSSIYLSSLKKPNERSLLIEETSAAAAYSPARGKHPEYLYWSRQQALVAQVFDSKHGRLLGDAVQVPGAEIVSLNAALGRSSVSASNDGTIVFGTGSDRYQLIWFTRDGKMLGGVGQPDRFTSIRLSPDGTRIVTGIVDSSSRADLWLLEMSHAIPTRLTSEGVFGTGAWAPDGQQIGYHLLTDRRLLETSASGAGVEQTILRSQYTVYMNEWSPDGKYLVFTQQSPEGRSELWLIATRQDGKPQPFLRGDFNALHGTLSPDSKWIAYTSDESKSLNEVYVTSFPMPSRRWRVSSGGGSFPRWSRTGNELFYRALDGTLMTASVQSSPGILKFGTPTALFRVTEPAGMFAYPYDVAPNGQKILALVPSKGAEDRPSLSVLINWDLKIRSHTK